MRHPTKHLSIATSLVSLLIGGCAAPTPRVLTPQGLLGDVPWTEAQRRQEIAVHPVQRSAAGSTSIVRVRTAEKPHVHEKTDLVVTVLRGTVRMHLAQQMVQLSPGDVIVIPRGVEHWAQNLGPGAAEALVAASPAYDGSDMRLLDPPSP